MKRVIAARGSVLVFSVIAVAVGLAAPSAEAALASWVTSVQYKTITLSNGNSTSSATLSSGTTIANCVPFVSMYTTGTDGIHGRTQVDIDFVAGSPPSVRASRSQTTGAVYVSIYVVEFNSSNVRVQQGTFSLTSATSTTATLSTAADTTKAAMVFYHLNSLNTDDWSAAAVEGWIDLTSNPSSTLNFQRGATGSSTLTGHWYVFEALGTQFTVQHGSCNMSGNTYCDVTLGSAVTMSKTFITSSYRSDDSMADKCRRNAMSSYMTGTATVRSLRSMGVLGDSRPVHVSAVTFGTDGFVQRNSWIGSAGVSSGTVTINAVETATAVVWPAPNSGSPGMGNTGNFVSADAEDHYVQLALASSTQVSATRGGTSSSATFDFEIVEWKAAPTAIELVGATARRYGSRVRLDWQTGFEADNLGFHVYREVDGRRERVTPELVAGTALLAGGARLRAGNAYGLWDDAAREGGRYWLEAWDLSGERVWHGPFEVEPGAGGPPSGKPSRLLRGLGAGGQARILERPFDGAASGLPTKAVAVSGPAGLNAGSLAAAVRAPRGEVRSVDRQWLVAGAGAVKLGVRRDGWHRVGLDELLAAGLDPAVDPRRLVLFTDGAEVPIHVVGGDDGRLDSGDAVEWYGRGLDTVSTDTRVYYLLVGEANGQRVGTTSAAGSGSAAPPSFPFEVVREDQSVHFPALKNGELDNFFGPVLAGEAVNQGLPVHHVDATDAVALVARLQGVSKGLHRIGVRLNGRLLGTVEWLDDLAGEATFPVAAGVVVDGTAIVTFEPQGFEGDVSLIDRVTLRYGHTWTADAGTLECTAPSGAALTLAGFPQGALRVVDVTDPHHPVELEGRVSDAGWNRSWSGTVPGEGARVLLAFADSAALHPAWVRADRPSALWAADGADLVVVAPAEFLPAVGPLVRLREVQGLTVLTADVEDVFDEFGAGARGPEAVRRFLFHAASAWPHPARYALLVGDTTVDPRDYLALGVPDLVPTKLVETEYLETASDEWLADFDGDGLAELALGRLPAASADEAAAMAGKIVAYDGQAAGGAVVLVADVNDEENDFEAAIGQLRELVPAGVPVTSLYRSMLGDAGTRALLVDELRRGPALLNYVGHGSVQLWNGGVLTAELAAQLSTARSTVGVLMTCLNGYFQDPTGDGLAEALLKAPAGGAAAVWASTGLTEMIPQALMDQALLRALFAAGEAPLLGDAIRGAKAAMDDPDVRTTWVLLGDPTMRVR